MEHPTSNRRKSLRLKRCRYLPWAQVVAGSNPAAPTNKPNNLQSTGLDSGIGRATTGRPRRSVFVVAQAAVLLVALAASAKEPGGQSPADEYFAYFVRTTVARPGAGDAVKAAPGRTLAPMAITEGPMTLAEGLERALEIRRDGVCRVTPPALGRPGRATCYPAHRVDQVDVISPGN